jgi:hypothetical protein
VRCVSCGSFRSCRRWRSAACAIDPFVYGSKIASVGDWKIERQEDRVTGRPVSSAYVLTRLGSSNSTVVPQTISLQLMCFVGKPVVRFAFQAKVGTNVNSYLGYRFDDNPGMRSAHAS